MLRLNKMTRKSGSSALLIGLNVLLVLLLAGPLSGVAFAGPEKVAICHLDDEGNYNPISVSERALKAHLGHGDKVVGVDMDANCHPLDSDGDGVQDVADNCVDIANPGQEDRYGSSAGDACEDLDGDGTLDVDETHFCLSIDGVLLESRGLARCISSASTGTDPNVAVSNGDNSGNSHDGAFAGWSSGGYSSPGNGLHATAIGNNSTAITQLGFNNSAIAIDGGFVQITYNSGSAYGEVIVHTGGNNIATAIGHNSYATMVDTSNSTATGITGGGAQVGYSNNATAFAESGGWVYLSGGENSSGRAENGGQVAVYGNNNSGTASGAGSFAYVSGSNNSATATGDGAVAVAAEGSNNSATATGDGAYAEASNGNNNSATSTGVYTCAGNGDDNEVAVDEDLCNY
ncbi:MAG: hypothetical protein H6668_16130 [Ardenticatenaceae bacterium]|nr:hypothetical protein [Ardenticatenaceae bacterium]